jgi:hypothetical protein
MIFLFYISVDISALLGFAWELLRYIMLFLQSFGIIIYSNIERISNKWSGDCEYLLGYVSQKNCQL